jgi:hypothetical protein
MSDTPSKQSNKESSIKNSPSQSTSKQSQANDLYYMNAETAHNTYANLICREDKTNKKNTSLYNQELKDIELLKPSKKGLTTFESEQKEEKLGKKNFGTQKDLVKKNLDGSIGDDLQKGKYKFGKRRFDNLGVMNDFTKSKKPENTFRCEKNKIQSNARKRKLNDYYNVNPIEVLDKETIKEMNDSNRKKVAQRTKAFNDYMGSKKTEHLFKAYQTTPAFVDKITNNPENILKKSIMENRKTQPMYSRYKFKHYFVSNNKSNANNDNKDNNDNKKNKINDFQICQYVA